MFFRFLLSIILIGIGIASPWLVRDWLSAQPSERNVKTLVDSALEHPKKWAKWILPDRDEDQEAIVAESDPASAEATAESDRSDSTELGRRPYSFASATAKVLQGSLPGGSVESGAAPLFSSVSSAPTSFSKAVVEETGLALDGELSRMGLELGSPVFIRIFKEEKELEVWMKNPEANRYGLFKVYRIQDMSGTLGPKLREGDSQVPEGFYYVGSSRLRPATKHHLGMDLGYPNGLDRALGRSGGDILIHGGGRSPSSFALAPEHMSEVYTLGAEALDEGQRFFRVHVFPFRMTDKRMEQEWGRQPKWIEFWSNLKEGYDFFENANFPPSVQVGAKEYVFRLP